MSVIISCLSGYCTPVRATIGRFYLLLLVVAFLFRTFKCECVWVRIAYEQRILLLFRHHFQQCFFSAVFIFLPIIFVCVCAVLVFIIPVYRIRFVPHALHSLWKFFLFMGWWLSSCVALILFSISFWIELEPLCLNTNSFLFLVQHELYSTLS